MFNGYGLGALGGGGFQNLISRLQQARGNMGGQPLPTPMPGGAPSGAAPMPFYQPGQRYIPPSNGAPPMPVQAPPPAAGTPLAGIRPGAVNTAPPGLGSSTSPLAQMGSGRALPDLGPSSPFAGMASGGVAGRGLGGMGAAPRGLIASAVPGRTDQLPMKVKPNSYIIPADVVSGIGQGNTLAGAKIFDQLLKGAPYGASPAKMSRGPGPPKAPPAFSYKKADGGSVGEVPIVTAGGEYVIDPEQVAAVGGGDMSAGHEYLDNMVRMVRKQVLKHTAALPGPRR